MGMLLAGAIGTGRCAGVSAEGVAILPEYCQDVMNDRHRALEKWGPTLGPTVQHVHHYCRGLYQMGQAQRIVNQKKSNYLWHVAVNEISYTIRNAPPDFVLLPEMFYKRGISWSKFGRPREAEADFKRAIEIHPSYYPAYASLAELYRDSNRLAMARTIVSDGLRHSPESKALLQLQNELRGAGDSDHHRAKVSEPPN